MVTDKAPERADPNQSVVPWLLTIESASPEQTVSTCKRAADTIQALEAERDALRDMLDEQISKFDTKLHEPRCVRECCSL